MEMDLNLMAGYVKLHRSILKHWLWNGPEPKSRFEAFVYLILMAEHDDEKKLIGGQLVEIKRGEIAIKQRDLALELRWHRSKIKNFLTLLSKDGIATINSNKKYTLIALNNYDKYHSVNKQRTKVRPKSDQSSANNLEEFQDELSTSEILKTENIVTTKQVKNTKKREVSVPIILPITNSESKSYKKPLTNEDIYLNKYDHNSDKILNSLNPLLVHTTLSLLISYKDGRTNLEPISDQSAAQMCTTKEPVNLKNKYYNLFSSSSKGAREEIFFSKKEKEQEEIQNTPLSAPPPNTKPYQSPSITAMSFLPIEKCMEEFLFEQNVTVQFRNQVIQYGQFMGREHEMEKWAKAFNRWIASELITEMALHMWCKRFYSWITKYDTITRNPDEINPEITTQKTFTNGKQHTNQSGSRQAKPATYGGFTAEQIAKLHHDVTGRKAGD